MRLRSLALAFALVLTLAPAALAAKATVHFFVIPAAIPAEQLAKLNDFLITTAGGFTASRSTGGDMGDLGRDYRPENISYTVSAPKNVAREIIGDLKKNCGQKGVFMLTWPATSVDS
ncbi:MAG: hypothetical protein KKA55_05780 [Proteobacteria bacterium]|nr:hypothetical protein [Pseudomonadota bacterium]MBU1595031.1 hypothetical protein [Pseudomonadota bacterium]